MDTRDFYIPLNQKLKKGNLIVVVAVALIGCAVAALTSIIWYAISGLGFAHLGHILGYYADNYRQPCKITVSDNGILLQYRKKRPKLIAWHQVQRLSISKRPGKTVTDAALKPIMGDWIGLTNEAGHYIADGYRMIYGRPIPGREGH